MKQKKILLTVGLVLLLSGCARYSYRISDPQYPVSFSHEKAPGEVSRRFFIKRKITFILFDLVRVQTFDMGRVLKEELPNAKRIYDLRIRSHEDGADSIFRIFGTFIQVFAFVSDRPFISRRTLILEGVVVE